MVRLVIFCNRIAKIRYDCGVILVKKQKEGTDGVFFHYKYWPKKFMGFSSIENSEIKYAGVFSYLMCLNKVQLKPYIVENAKKRYGWGVFPIELLK